MVISEDHEIRWVASWSRSWVLLWLVDANMQIQSESAGQLKGLDPDSGNGIFFICPAILR